MDSNLFYYWIKTLQKIEFKREESLGQTIFPSSKQSKVTVVPAKLQEVKDKGCGKQNPERKTKRSLKTDENHKNLIFIIIQEPHKTPLQ